MHYYPFGCIWDCFATARKGAKLVQLMQKFVPQSCVGIFRNDAPDPHHWTLNSCFGAFLSVWVHLEPFRYCTKRRQTGAINAKVRATKSCRNFSQQHSRSTPLDPKLMFWCVSFCLSAFVTILLLPETWCKTCQTGAINVKVRAMKSCHNFSQRMLKIHTIGH